MIPLIKTMAQLWPLYYFIIPAAYLNFLTCLLKTLPLCGASGRLARAAAECPLGELISH